MKNKERKRWQRVEASKKASLHFFQKRKVKENENLSGKE